MWRTSSSGISSRFIKVMACGQSMCTYRRGANTKSLGLLQVIDQGVVGFFGEVGVIFAVLTGEFYVTSET